MKTIANIAILILSIALFNCSSKNTIARQEFPLSELTLERIQRDTIVTLDSLTRSQILEPRHGPVTRKMEFKITDKDSVSLTLYDVLGSSVTKTFMALLNSGRYFVKLDSLGLESGVYYFRLSIGSKVNIKKIIILK